MSNLIPPRSRQQALTVDHQASKAVANAELPALVAMAHVHGGAFVASVAMQNGCMLSRAADAAFKVSPMGEELYRSILMAYGNLAVTEIQALSLHGKGVMS
jgi:hypothetical protein